MKKTLATLTFILASTLVVASSTPVFAGTDKPWRTPPASRLSALDAELAPVLVDLQEMRSIVPGAVLGLSRAVGSLNSELIVAKSEQMDAAFARLGEVAVAGLTVLDRYTPEPCYSDYYSVVKTGFLMVGDAADNPAVGAKLFNVGTYLILDYGELIHGITDCG